MYNYFYHGNYSDVFYCLYLWKDLITIINVQDFDMDDYIFHNLIKNSNGQIHRFNSEDTAIAKLREWYKNEEIDKKYRIHIDNRLVRE